MQTRDRASVVILGAGLTGLSTALHWQADRDTGAPGGALLVEREQRVGGKARSERREGYTFDVTGHWLHLRDARVRALMQRLFAPGDLVEIERRTGIYTHETMLPYPFQANLYGLPLAVVRECMVGFIRAQALASARPEARPRTFEEFAVSRFGEGMARHFFVPYNRKLWGEAYDHLTPDWVSRFIPLPDVDQVVGGAIGLRQEGLGYNARFHYPRHGGIDAIPEAMATEVVKRSAVALRTGVAVDAVDFGGRRVKLAAHDSWVEYGKLVSTLPMPELIARGTEVPPAVREAASRLRSVKWRWLDIATRSRVELAEHWVYVPDPAVPFFRVGVYSNALSAMAPPGASSLYVELSDRLTPPDLPGIYDELVKIGLLANVNDVAFAQVRDIQCAYVVFDEHHAGATQTIREWLASMDVRSCGRYGAWTYNSMEDCIIEGMEAAEWAST